MQLILAKIPNKVIQTQTNQQKDLKIILGSIITTFLITHLRHNIKNLRE